MGIIEFPYVRETEVYTIGGHTEPTSYAPVSSARVHLLFCHGDAEAMKRYCSE